MTAKRYWEDVIADNLLLYLIGAVMIGVLIYPPTMMCGPNGCSQSLNDIFLPSHYLFIWEYKGIQTGFYFKPNYQLVALYELALAGVGAVIHLFTGK